MDNWSVRCYIREDGTGKVYLHHAPNAPTPFYENECLLYDFGVSAGDTVRSNCNGCMESCLMIVSAIDQEPIFGKTRSVISFGGHEKWIEGIGSNIGLLNSAWHMIGGAELLLCFMENDTVRYRATGYDDCYIDMSDIEDAPTKMAGQDLTINPNPFRPFTSISYNLSPNATGAMQIFDIRGKMVFERPIQGSGTLTWDARGLGSGLYMLKVFSVEKTYSRKLVLQR
jgi:hypothetical protein